MISFVSPSSMVSSEQYLKLILGGSWSDLPSVHFSECGWHFHERQCQYCSLFLPACLSPIVMTQSTMSRESISKDIRHFFPYNHPFVVWTTLSLDLCISGPLPPVCSGILACMDHEVIHGRNVIHRF